MPTPPMPSFFASTMVVPVPQKGSRRVAPSPSPKRFTYSRTRWGGKERTKRYQRWTA